MDDATLFNTSCLWSFQIGTYDLRCVSVEDFDTGHHTLTVTENGRELERHEIHTTLDTWQEPFDFAERLRLRYYSRMIDETKKAQRFRR